MTMKFELKIIATGALLMSLSACATTDSSMTGDTFGAAVRHNIAVQFVEPTPEQKQNTYIRPSPERTALALERYKTDEVEKTESQSTIE